MTGSNGARAQSRRSPCSKGYSLRKDRERRKQRASFPPIDSSFDFVSVIWPPTGFKEYELVRVSPRYRCPNLDLPIPARKTGLTLSPGFRWVVRCCRTIPRISPCLHRHVRVPPTESVLRGTSVHGHMEATERDEKSSISGEDWRISGPSRNRQFEVKCRKRRRRTPRGAHSHHSQEGRILSFPRMRRVEDD